MFIDESGSTTEPSTLVPIAGVISSDDKIHGQIVLAGDPKQLGPVVIAEKAKACLGELIVLFIVYFREKNVKRVN